MDKDGILVAEYWTTLLPKAEFEQKIHAILTEARERLTQRCLLLPVENGVQLEEYTDEYSTPCGD